MPMLQLLAPDGKLTGDKELLLSSDDLRQLYRLMLKIRVLDQKMINLQRQGRIAFHGLTTGEEAAVIGSAYALKPTDWVFPALRQSGVMLTRGWTLRKYVAQSMGNGEDVLKGKMQPCHYADRSVNFVSWSSNIGTQLPHAVGAAYAMKLKKHSTIAFAYIGDGGTSSADFHVAVNFAAVWKVPCVFFIQNNQWAISVSRRNQTASASLAEKAAAYGMEGVQVDGNDVLAVHQATARAADKARMGEGPTLIEAVTFRRGGHSSSDDPTRYRSDAEVLEWEKKDPLDRFRTYLESRSLWNVGEQSKAETEISDELDEAVRHNEQARPPALSSLIEDVYAEPLWNQKEQFAQFLEVCGPDFTGVAEGKFPL